MPPFFLESTPNLLQHPLRPYLTQPLTSSLPSHRAPSLSCFMLLPGICAGWSPAWSSSPRCLLGSLPHLLPGFVHLPLLGEACPAHPLQHCKLPPARSARVPPCPACPLSSFSAYYFLTCSELLSSTMLFAVPLSQNEPHKGRWGVACLGLLAHGSCE